MRLQRKISVNDDNMHRIIIISKCVLNSIVLVNPALQIARGGRGNGVGVELGVGDGVDAVLARVVGLPRRRPCLHRRREPARGRVEGGAELLGQAAAELCAPLAADLRLAHAVEHEDKVSLQRVEHGKETLHHYAGRLDQG